MPARNAVGALDRGAVGDLVGPAVQVEPGHLEQRRERGIITECAAGAAVLLRGA